MVAKVIGLLTSVRFWIVTLTAVVSVLSGTDFLTTFQVWAAAVVGIGTADSVATRLSK